MTQGSVLLLGAHSDIGRAIARAFARTGRPLILAARRAERLERDAQDLRLRHDIEVKVMEWDVLDVARHGALISQLDSLPEIAVSVVGLLGEQAKSETDCQAAKLVIETNYVAPALLLGEIAERMAARGHGTIIGVSSVAGERGRASNYVYGSAKAGFTAFLSGLRARMWRRGVRVVTVKPGFVTTEMTAGMKLPPLLTATADEVGRAVVAASERGACVVYVRRRWWPIMAIIKLLPERIFMRLKF
ncbi:MAG TPA: SDR family oxidoreductase [Alphaproteobacteria bacterium]|nr:SDR family oxidoreductase [Alphaproteobacteria bacterium]